VVKTGHWHSGKEILILPDQIDEISFAEQKMTVNLTKQDAQITARDRIVQPTPGGFEAVDFHD